MDQTPTPRPLAGDWRAAEQCAAEWMRFLGYLDAARTGDGPDKGIDVRASGAAAQVKAKAAASSRPDLQRLMGATAREQPNLLFFSTGGFTRDAITWAEETGIALFTLTSTGGVLEMSSAARELMLAATTRATAPNMPPPPTRRGHVPYSSTPPPRPPAPSRAWWRRGDAAAFFAFCFWVGAGVGVLSVLITVVTGRTTGEEGTNLGASLIAALIGLWLWRGRHDT